MRLSILVNWAPCSDHAYEDRFWPRQRARENIELITFRAAVADGTSTASFSAIWAQLLVLSFTGGHLDAGLLSASLPALQERWLRKARSRLQGRILPWYADAKLKQGSASTLLGLELRAHETNQAMCRWRATTVGDSCLAHIREHAVRDFLPVKRVEDFSNHPSLISTLAESIESIDVSTSEGVAEVGDSFYLMTDAIAKWFLKEANERPWEILSGFDVDHPGRSSFSDWVQQRRQADEMDDDDVTVLRLDLKE